MASMCQFRRNIAPWLEPSYRTMQEPNPFKQFFGWTWSPGFGRQPAPGKQKEAGASRSALKSGAVCPANDSVTTELRFYRSKDENTHYRLAVTFLMIVSESWTTSFFNWPFSLSRLSNTCFNCTSWSDSLKQCDHLPLRMTSDIFSAFGLVVMATIISHQLGHRTLVLSAELAR
jgi:hypothetical protein